MFIQEISIIIILGCRKLESVWPAQQIIKLPPGGDFISFYFFEKKCYTSGFKRFVNLFSYSLRAKLSSSLINAGITSFQKIEQANPRELEMIILRTIYGRCAIKSRLKNLAIFTGKHLCWSLFLIKLHVFRGILRNTVSTQKLKHRFFPANTAKFLRTAFFIRTPPLITHSIPLGSFYTS